MVGSSGPQHDLEKGLQSHIATSVNSETIGTTATTPAQCPDEDAHDPDVVGWDGPDDPENPFNWKKYKKARQLVFMAFNTFLTYVTPWLLTMRR